MKITMDILKKINKLYDEGATMHKLAKQFDVCYDTINSHIWNPRHPGIFKGQKKVVKDETVKLINDKYDEGMTTREVAKLLHLSSVTVCKYILNKRKRGPVICL